MAFVKWNTATFEDEIARATIDGLEAIANKIRDDAKTILKQKISASKTPKITRPVYKRGVYAGQAWTAREPYALVDTIRVVKKRDSNERNVWIMAGNKVVWWAIQTEYGRGGWKGGAKPFLRPALKQMIKARVEKILSQHTIGEVGPGKISVETYAYRPTLRGY